MDNYKAIISMDRDTLEKLLDQIYCTGLNNGLYAAKQSENEKADLLSENPFDAAWLSASAEDELVDVDECILDALAKAVLRNAGITDTKMNN